MKSIILYVFKYLGGFWFARKLVCNKTLILAYHSFETIDETNFRPKLFIKSSTFERRLRYLKKYSNIINLNDISKVDKPNNSVVITIDDGWASTLTLAAPLLKNYNFPYTIYLTTESVLAEQPIFHILLDYILRGSLGKTLSLDDFKEKLLSPVITLGSIPEITKKVDALKVTKYDTDLLRRIAQDLGFNLNEVISKKSFTLLSLEEILAIIDLGANIELHTHTHYTHLDDEKAFNNEIIINQKNIERITGVKPVHHCYPSGSFNQSSSQYLKALGIQSATTCNPGFCDANSNIFELPRFLDGENIPQIIFEAEVSGVLELFRKLKRLL